MYRCKECADQILRLSEYHLPGCADSIHRRVCEWEAIYCHGTYKEEALLLHFELSDQACLESAHVPRCFPVQCFMPSGFKGSDGPIIRLDLSLFLPIHHVHVRRHKCKAPLCMKGEAPDEEVELFGLSVTSS